MSGSISAIRTAPTVLDALRRRWPIAALGSMLVFGGLLFVILHLKPLYTSKTTLLVPFTPLTELSVRRDGGFNAQADPVIVHSYIQIMKNDGICLTVIKQLRLATLSEFDPPPGRLSHLLGRLTRLLSKPEGSDVSRQEQVLRIYKSRLNVYNDGRSLAVDLSFQSRQPALAAAIVNAHAEAYLAAQIQYRRHEAETKTAWIEEQVMQSAKDLRVAQLALQLHQLSTHSVTAASAAEESADLKFRQSIIAAKQGVYESLQTRQQMLAAEQHYDGSDTRILSPASEATQPSFPNLPLFISVALLASVISGTAAAWAVDMVVGVPQALGAWLQARQVEVLATIEFPGHTPSFLVPRQRRKLRMALFLEKMRGLRSILSFHQDGGLVLAVTSAAPHQGTSVIATFLARATAASGLGTLLLDLDVRCPRCHRLLGLAEEETAGEGEVLSRHRIRPVPGSKSLFLLSGAHRDGSDVLGGSAMRSSLRELRPDYPAIIMDTPPIGVICDALAVADLASQVVLVCDADHPNLIAMDRAITELRRRGAAIRGIVLTSQRPASRSECRAISGYIAAASSPTQLPGAAVRSPGPVVAAVQAAE